MCTQIPPSSKTYVQGTLPALSLPHHLEVLVEITPKIKIYKLLFYTQDHSLSASESSVALFILQLPQLFICYHFQKLIFYIFFVVSRSPVTKSTFLPVYLLILNILQMVLRQNLRNNCSLIIKAWLCFDFISIYENLLS